MLATIEQRINTSEKRVIAKLEQHHAETLKEIAELRGLLVSKNDAVAASIQSLSSLFGVK